MKGYGLTTVHGSAVERFDVEVLGVVPNSLGRSQIIVRVSVSTVLPLVTSGVTS